MNFKAHKTELQAILPLRNLFLQETNFQIRYNACHERGWTASYLLTSDEVEIGYGSIKGQEIADRDTIFEFYLIPPFRKFSSLVFPELIAASGARFIECQSNDVLLTSMLFEFAQNINSDVVLFKENFRRKGLGSFILQELKKACYLSGRVPAARTSIQNKASRAALLKAGLRICGFMLKGDIKSMNGNMN